MKRLRIGYLSVADPNNVRAWSGIHYPVFRQLQEKFGDVIPLGPHEEKNIVLAGRIRSAINRKLTGKRFDYLHTLRLAKAYGAFFTKRIQQEKPDCIFAVAASTELAYLDTKLPVFYIADATFANMIDYYPFYTNLTKGSLQEGNAIQREALKKCTELFYPSEWAANSAVRDYGVPSERVHVLPFGANLHAASSTSKERSLAQKTVKLLFVGVEWERKGGPLALETFQYLRQRGWNASLCIVGCTPDVKQDGVTIIPFLDKSDPAQQQQLISLFAESDFFILPTKAECFGVVFCEASAVGTPSIAMSTGGVSGAIRNGINGILLAPDASAAQFGDRIMEVMSSGNYIALRNSSREWYESTLNWNAWGDTVKQHVGKHF